MRGQIIIASFLLVLVFPQAPSIAAQSAEEAYVQKQYLETQLFVRTLGRFGAEARVAAILEACGREGLAKSLAPAPFDVAKHAADQLRRVAEWSPQHVALTQALTDDEVVALAQGAATKLWAYRWGYREATANLKGSGPICDVGMEAADDLLKARAAGK